MPLDPSRVRRALVPLLPVVERWGIADDFDREAAVSAASVDELKALIHSIDGVSDEELFAWLSGPEAVNPNPSDEYVALVAFDMAIESAKLELRRRRGIGY